METNELVVVIPAYEPNNLLVELVEKLNQYFNYCKIVVVNDGSVKDPAKEAFAKISEFSNVILINHEVNKGKGAALKTAYKYIAEMDNEHHIIVSCDSDGQHKPEDIYKVAQYYDSIRDGLVLGSRQFEGKVPLRSRFGNDATRFLYRLQNSKSLSDNQTGLRAFGSELLPFMMSIKGNRYEYEMNVLMECQRSAIMVSEVKIETVYINSNAESHFRPVRDFLKICKHMLKYAIPAFIALLTDIGSFIGFSFLYKNLAERNIYLGVLATTASSCCVALIINLLIHKLGILYGNKNIFKIKALKKRYALLTSMNIILTTSLVFAMYVLIHDFALGKTFGEIDIIAIGLVLNYALAPKAKVQ